MIKVLIKLYRDRRELTLLETAYCFLTIISFVVAGTIALFNQTLGISVLILPLVTLLTGIGNIIVWSLVKLFIENMAEKREDKKPIKK